MNSTKIKRIGVTISEVDSEIWNMVSRDLIQRKIFRSKAEIFEAMIYYLQKANNEELIKFSDSSKILIV